MAQEDVPRWFFDDLELHTAATFWNMSARELLAMEGYQRREWVNRALYIESVRHEAIKANRKS